MKKNSMDSKTKLAELRQRLAAISDKVEAQNAAQKALGPGSRQAEDSVTKKNSDDALSKGNKVEKQNANQQEIYNQGGNKDPSTKAKPSTLSTGTF